MNRIGFGTTQQPAPALKTLRFGFAAGQESDLDDLSTTVSAAPNKESAKDGMGDSSLAHSGDSSLDYSSDYSPDYSTIEPFRMPGLPDGAYPGKAIIDRLISLPVIGRLVRAGVAFVSGMAGGFGILAMAAPTEEAQKKLMDRTPDVVHLPTMMGLLAALITLFTSRPKEKTPVA